jgi:hypothetical protein
MLKWLGGDVAECALDQGEIRPGSERCLRQYKARAREAVALLLHLSISGYCWISGRGPAFLPGRRVMQRLRGNSHSRPPSLKVEPVLTSQSHGGQQLWI